MGEELGCVWRIWGFMEYKAKDVLPARRLQGGVVGHLSPGQDASGCHGAGSWPVARRAQDVSWC